MYKQMIQGEIDRQTYNKYCEVLKQVVSKAKQMANIDFNDYSKNKSKATWQILKGLTSRNTSTRNYTYQNYTNKKQLTHDFTTRTLFQTLDKKNTVILK